MTSDSPAAPQEGTTPPAIIGCDPECTAEGGYPALCEMYPDEKHAGCSRQRVSSSGTTTDETTPTFLTIGRGGDRVYCVGCKAWQPSEGYCEGDPDICPIGEEDQGRSPSLAEAQNAIDLLAAEMRKLDDDAAEQIRALQSEIAQLRSSQTDSSLRAAEPTTFNAEDVAFLRRCADAEEAQFTASGLYIPNQRPRSFRDLADRIERQLAAVSSPTVTPPQTPTERESCARVCESRARSLREDGQHGEANEAKKCAAAIRARLDESPLRPIRAASPPVTEEAPNEKAMAAIRSMLYLDGTRDITKPDHPLVVSWLGLKYEELPPFETVDEALEYLAARSTPTEGKTNAG